MDWMKSPSYDERRDKHDSEVYVYLDEDNKVAYVGLSIDVKNRKRSHKYQQNSAVKKHFGKNIPEPIILKENLTLDESTYWEDYYRNQYEKDGYKLLNVAPTGVGTGSLGGIPKWSSKEVIFKESRKYHSRSEFKRMSGSAYHHAISNGWLEEMHWLKKAKVVLKWTRERVFEESHKYKYRGEFCDGSPRAYIVAKENGWLEEMPWVTEIRKPSNYWTRSRVFEESRKYTNKKEFEANANGAFQKAMKNGWLKEMLWLKPLPLGKISIWTRERIIVESKKYKSRTEFAKESPTAYHHACEDKTIFMEMPWIVEKKKPDGWWNDKEKVMKEGKKYQTRTAFANGSYSAWKTARKEGWIDEMTWLENVRKK
ncbi:MAG: GIY-YIG nuclease family protein [Bacteroidaceae bacterium]|nr:GIY-YIG nuclease family protein [Bacteroidaceae bacterium]